MNVVKLTKNIADRVMTPICGEESPKNDIMG